MGIGQYRHVVRFETPGPPVPDGEGGTVESWTDLPPAWNVDIRPATVRDLERRAAGTIVASATHIVRGRYRDDVTIDDRIVFDGRFFRIAGIANPEERDRELFLFAVETV